MKRERTKFPGVYQRVLEKRKHENKPDVCFDISYKQDGRKIWEKVGLLSEGYSAKLAADVRSDRLRSIRHSEELPKQRKKAPLLKDVWAKYKKWGETNKTRRGSVDVSRWNCHLKDRFENKRLNEISSFDLEKLKTDLSKKGLSPASIKHCLVLMRQLYNKAIAWGLYRGENPIQGVKLPTLSNGRTRFLTHGEAGLLLKTLKQDTRFKKKVVDLEDPQLHDMALLSLHCGLRAGEVFALRGHDIDFDNEIITIRDPKNKTTRHAYMTTQIKEMLMSRQPAEPAGLVFTDATDKQIQSVSHRFRKIVEDLGFNKGVTDPRQKVNFHTLRHTFASWLAMQGESLITLKELLGHKSTAMTERYSHLMPDHKRRAIMNLERDMNKTNEKEKAEEIRTA